MFHSNVSALKILRCRRPAASSATVLLLGVVLAFVCTAGHAATVFGERQKGAVRSDGQAEGKLMADLEAAILSRADHYDSSRSIASSRQLFAVMGWISTWSTPRPPAPVGRSPGDAGDRSGN